MAITVQYDADGRLILPKINCDCGCEHHSSQIDVYIGKNLIVKLPDFIKRRVPGKKCVLVADNNTFAIAGRDALEALEKAGYEVMPCVIEREGEMEPDESAVGEVLMTMSMDTDFLVAVGSGSVTDITRITAAHTRRPFVSVGTAPSMDGYTSTVAPLLLRGLKINAPAICPQVIVCDLDIMRTAPKEMFLSGAGDVLGKFIAKADWEIGNIINGEPCCPVCCEMAVGAAQKVLDHIDEIAQRTEKGTRLLIEALILAGMTIMIVNNTRAVASVEHSFGHYWDMEMLKAGLKPARHGTAVGVATLLVWPVFERFAALDPASFSIEKALKNNPTREERVAFMNAHYGEKSAATIMRENPEDFLSDDVLRRRFSAAVSRFEELRAVIAKLPDSAEVKRAIELLGGPVTPAQIGVDDDLLSRSIACAKDYRSRYTLFKTIAELGLDVNVLM